MPRGCCQLCNAGRFTRFTTVHLNMSLCGFLQRVSVWLHPHVPSGAVHSMAMTGHCIDDVAATVGIAVI
jgi:hypothetical protein